MSRPSRKVYSQPFGRPGKIHSSRLSQPSSAPSTLLNGLVFGYKMDGASGADEVDVSGNGYTATDVNSVPTVAGKIGNCKDFARGNSHHYLIANDANTQFGDRDWAVSCWVQRQGSGTSTILSEWRGGTARAFNLFCTATKFSVQLSDGTDVGGVQTINHTQAPTVNTWFHLVLQNDASENEIQFFVDDDPETTTTTETIGTTAISLELGSANSGTLEMSGLIDELYRWNRILTSAEITQLFDAGPDATYPFS